MRSKLLLMAAALLLLCSCSQVSAQLNGNEVSQDRASASVRPVLETVDWASLDGMISVLVRNTSDRTLRRADAVITLLDPSGATIRSSVAQTVEGRCCTAVDVPPGGTFGFYLYSETGEDVTDVMVSYRKVSWEQSGSRGGPQAYADPSGVYRNDVGAVVRANVTTEGGPIDAAVIQAVLNDVDGEFLAVISGTWYCLEPGIPREIDMQIFQEVPSGATVEGVTVFPKANALEGGDANASEPCPAAQG